MNEEHSKFSPSQMPRIIRCPGSVRDTETVLKESSAYAQEGTMLHSVVEECLTFNEHTVHPATIKRFKLEQEHVDAVQECLDWIIALRFKHADCADAYEVVEQKVSLGPYACVTGCELLTDCYGTLDYSFVVPEENLLYVTDWKFGKGVEVWPDTEQLKTYALGRIASLKAQIKKVVLVVGQPRLYSGELFKEYETTRAELYEWLYQDLIPALNNSQSKHPIYRPTNKGCMWCSIKAVCKYRKDQAMKAAASVFAIHAKLPGKTDEEELADFLYKLPDLKKYIADIELYAMNILKDGKVIPGWKLVPGRSIRQWVNEDAAKTFYYSLELYDIEDLTITKFKSPTQIEKLVGKKNLTEEELALVHKPAGKPTMVPDSDKREAITYETASEKFAMYVD